MQLRSGHDTLARQDEQALMRELYPTPDPEIHRASPETLIVAVDQISKDKELSEDERLRQCHRMLELCAAEHEREVQGYQAVHRHLMEHEEQFGTMLLTYPEVVSEEGFDAWESKLRQDMKDDRSELKDSRARTEAFLKASKYIERRLKKAGDKVIAEGKEDHRLLGEASSPSSRILEQQMIKLEVDAEMENRERQEALEG